MRAIIVSLTTLLLLPFIAGLAVEVAKPWLPTGNAVLGFLLTLYEAAAFPWVVGGGLGLLLGLWLDRLSAVIDGRHPLTTAGKMRRLAPRVADLAMRCEALLSPRSHRFFDENTVRAEVLIVGNKLTKLGLIQPYVPINMSREDMLECISMMFRAIGPALEEGDVKTARLLSSSIRESQINHYGLKYQPSQSSEG